MINIIFPQQLIVIIVVLILSSISTQSKSQSPSLSDQYDSILRRALDTLQNGNPAEAYKITAELENICIRIKDNGELPFCDPEKGAKIRRDFLYELKFDDAFVLAMSGEHRKALDILDGIEPSCVIDRPDSCKERYQWLLNTLNISIVRENAGRLVNANDYVSATEELRNAKSYYYAISDVERIDYHWELASVLSFYAPREAVSEVRPLVKTRQYKSILPMSNYFSYLTWLSKARESKELADELVIFFKASLEYGGMIEAFSPQYTDDETLNGLDIFLEGFSSLNTNIETLSQALLEVIDITEGEVKSLIMRRTADFVLLKSNRERLATRLYKRSGLSDSNIDRIFKERSIGLPGITSNTHTVSDESNLSVQLKTTLSEMLDGSEDDTAMLKLFKIWEKIPPYEISDITGEYVFATLLLFGAAPNDETKKHVLLHGYSSVSNIFVKHKKSFFGKNVSLDNYTRVLLMEYENLLPLASMRAEALGGKDEALEFATERLRINEVLHGEKSYQLLPSLSAIATIYQNHENDILFTETFSRGKSIELNNLVDLSLCNVRPFRFEYSLNYARDVLNNQTIKDWFIDEGASHLENAKRFIGIEDQYQCVKSVRWLMSEYMYLLNDRNFDEEMMYELAQVADITDLAISSELGLEKLNSNDPQLSSLLSDYGRLSHDVNVETVVDSDHADLDRFRLYSRKKNELYEEIEAKFPEIGSLLVAEGVSVAETQNRLTADESVLYYVEIPTIENDTFSLDDSGQSSYLLFVINREGVSLIPLGSHSLDYVKNNMQKIKNSLDQVAVLRLSKLAPFDIDAAKYIFDTFVSPAISIIGTSTRLLIIPSESLTGIPFELLPSNDELPKVSSFIDFKKYRDVRWLNDLHSMSYLSSPRILERRNDVAKLEDIEFLGIGNPTFSTPDNLDLTVNATVDLTPSPVGLESLLADDYKALSAAGAGVSNLPETQLIIDSMARRYGNRATLLTRDIATESRLSQLDLSEYSTIAFATHGLLGSENISEPALMLGREADNSSFDGLLTAREIVSMKLRAKLVVLAACNTATIERARGLVSLSNSFLTAGSAAVIASHWAVDANATTMLFKSFARHQAMKPANLTSDLLREARIDILRNNKNQLLAHPTFWGGFTAYGF